MKSAHLSVIVSDAVIHDERVCLTVTHSRRAKCKNGIKLEWCDVRVSYRDGIFDANDLIAK